MAEVTCALFESTKEGLERAPLPGQIGARILEGTCPGCWTEWSGEQVKLMNENRLTPADPKHYEFLIEALKKFLKL